jgi:hypothetical protein
MSMLWRLVYTSRRQPDDDASVIASIQQSAALNNARDGLAGALVVSPSRFAQVLEGPRDALERTFERIIRDRRHEDVLVMSFAPIDAMVFSDFQLKILTMDDDPAGSGETAAEAMLAELQASMNRLDIVHAMSQR